MKAQKLDDTRFNRALLMLNSIISTSNRHLNLCIISICLGSTPLTVAAASLESLTSPAAAPTSVVITPTITLPANLPPKDPVYIHVTPFPPGGDFQLTSSSGPVTLHALRGKVVLLFFGYTSCPDVCPMSMVTVAEVFTRLTAKHKARFTAVFISVDPDRDTPEQLKNFAAYFDAPIIGVTGTAAEISELAERYGAQYRRVDLPDSSMGYAVDHSAALYLIDPNGALQTLYRHDAPPKKIASDIQKLLTKKLRKR